MFFNHTLNDANEDFFNLMVWRDNNGKPGEVMYSNLTKKLNYSPNLLGFHTYMLDTAIACERNILYRLGTTDRR